MSLLNALLNNDDTFYVLVSESMQEYVSEAIEDLREDTGDDFLGEARFSIVNRVRGGKIQRRRKVSNMPGYRFQDGRLVRMSTRERLHRKMAQRKGAIKRKSKMGIALRRRKISIRRRGNL